MKHALVTGSAKRIGRCIALELAQAGWDVTIHYNSSHQAAETLAEEIRELGQNAYTLQANFEQPDQVENLLTHTEMPLTALVNNASLFVLDKDDPDGTRHDQINFKAPISLTAQFVGQLPSGQKGSVIQILDNTQRPDQFSAYDKSRAALRETICGDAQRYAPHIRVNAVALGASLQNPRESDEHFQAMVLNSPLVCPSAPDDIARAVTFLLESSSVTGQILNVDAGLHIATKN